MLQNGMHIPSDITNMDLGYDVSKLRQQAMNTVSNSESNNNAPKINASGDGNHHESIVNAVDPIDYTSALGMIFAGRIHSTTGGQE